MNGFTVVTPPCLAIFTYFAAKMQSIVFINRHQKSNILENTQIHSIVFFLYTSIKPELSLSDFI